MVRFAAALAVVAALAGGAVRAQEILRPGDPQTLRLSPNSAAQYRIDAPPGSYIAGRIEAGDTAVDADLRDAAGRPLRHLSEAARGTTDFRALIETSPTILHLRGAGPIRLVLEAAVPPAAQTAAGPDYVSPSIAALARGGDIEAFWSAVAQQGTPLVEEAGDGQQIVTFLWRGAQRNVRLFGAPSNDHEWLERLAGTDLWFRSFTVPDSLRLSYKLAPDVPEIPGGPRERRAALLATAQVDPLNRFPWPAQAPDRFNQDATVTLRNAPVQPGTPPAADADPEQRTFTYDSAILGNRRDITLSFPRDLNPADPRIVVALIFDGDQAIRRMDAPRVLDTLTRSGRLPPVVAVLIPSIDSRTRARELPGNARFADALAEELLPRVEQALNIRVPAARTVLAGVSYGGLATATVALARPDRFGNALSMSGSFWWSPSDIDTDGTPYVVQQVAAQERLPLRFFLSAGLYETGRDGRGILETSRELRDVLRLKGYPVDWRLYTGGHDYLVWRGALAEGMLALFGTGPE